MMVAVRTSEAGALASKEKWKEEKRRKGKRREANGEGACGRKGEGRGETLSERDAVGFSSYRPIARPARKKHKRYIVGFLLQT